MGAIAVTGCSRTEQTNQTPAATDPVTTEAVEKSTQAEVVSWSEADMKLIDDAVDLYALILPYHLYNTAYEYIQTIKAFDTMEPYKQMKADGKTVVSYGELTSCAAFPGYFIEKYTKEQAGLEADRDNPGGPLCRIGFYEAVLADSQVFCALTDDEKAAVAAKAVGFYNDPVMYTLMNTGGGKGSEFFDAAFWQAQSGAGSFTYEYLEKNYKKEHDKHREEAQTLARQ